MKINFTTFTHLRVKKSVSKWIKLKEFKLYFLITIWISQCDKYAIPFYVLMDRIKVLVHSTGFNFTFNYLKVATHLTIQAINCSPIFGMSEPRVKRDHYGFPTLIPVEIRSIIRDRSHPDYVKVVKATLTSLSIFRTFSTQVEPKLSTIIAPFVGLSRTLNNVELAEVLKELKIRIYSGSFKGFISENAGPNGSKATWTSHLDALAMLSHPSQYIAFHLLALRSKSYGYMVWLNILLVLMGPLYGILLLFKVMSPMKLGKLSVVYDQAGKARIVAITNWWIQLALRPLHDSIFSNLSKIPQDGTFDQDGALDRLMANRAVEHKFYSFDLSAATDRLPIDLQVQILAILGYDSENWRRLLDFSWSWKDEQIKYSVGQPMGAYSSWAMLALTHHVIVRLAARRANVSSIPNYVVLGDDVVINHDDVAQEYLHIMKTLGVEINLSKSIISSEMVEFAKRWRTSENDLSPLGPGNILVTARESFFLGTLITEAQRKGFFADTSTLKSVIDSLPEKYFGKELSVALWAVLGIPDQPHLFASGAQKSASFWYVFERGINQAHRDHALYQALLEIVKERNSNNVKSVDDAEEAFNSGWSGASVSKTYATRLIERLFRVISPSYWLYALSFPNARVKAMQMEETLVKEFPTGKTVRGNLSKLVSWDPTLNARSIDWRDRNVVKDYTRFVKLLQVKFLHHLDVSGEMFYKQMYRK